MMLLQANRQGRGAERPFLPFTQQDCKAVWGRCAAFLPQQFRSQFVDCLSCRFSSQTPLFLANHMCFLI